MSRPAALALGCLLAIVGAGAAAERPATGREAKAGRNKAIAEALKTKRVTFDFVRTPLGDAAALVARLAGLSVVVDPALADRRVSLRAQEMTLAHALKWLARAAGGRMQVKGGTVHLVPDPRGKPPPRRAGRLVGTARLQLGDGVSVQLELRADDLPPGTRELLARALRQAIARRLRDAAGRAPPQ
ncbi:MAG: hypothetical protein ACLF0G_07030 [Candidatus Brocadiia bacterium]